MANADTDIYEKKTGGRQVQILTLWSELADERCSSPAPPKASWCLSIPCRRLSALTAPNIMSISSKLRPLVSGMIKEKVAIAPILMAAYMMKIFHPRWVIHVGVL